METTTTTNLICLVLFFVFFFFFLDLSVCLSHEIELTFPEIGFWPLLIERFDNNHFLDRDTTEKKASISFHAKRSNCSMH